MNFVLILTLAAAQDESLDKWRATILPRDFESGWRKIPWRPTFWDGVVEAQEKDKPLLLWIMNGHPLAET